MSQSSGSTATTTRDVRVPKTRSRTATKSKKTTSKTPSSAAGSKKSSVVPSSTRKTRRSVAAATTKTAVIANPAPMNIVAELEPSAPLASATTTSSLSSSGSKRPRTISGEASVQSPPGKRSKNTVPAPPQETRCKKCAMLISFGVSSHTDEPVELDEEGHIHRRSAGCMHIFVDSQAANLWEILCDPNSDYVCGRAVLLVRRPIVNTEDASAVWCARWHMFVNISNGMPTHAVLQALHDVTILGGGAYFLYPLATPPLSDFGTSSLASFKRLIASTQASQVDPLIATVQKIVDEPVTDWYRRLLYCLSSASALRTPESSVSLAYIAAWSDARDRSQLCFSPLSGDALRSFVVETMIQATVGLARSGTPVVEVTAALGGNSTPLLYVRVTDSDECADNEEEESGAEELEGEPHFDLSRTGARVEFLEFGPLCYGRRVSAAEKESACTTPVHPLVARLNIRPLVSLTLGPRLRMGFALSVLLNGVEHPRNEVNRWRSLGLKVPRSVSKTDVFDVWYGDVLELASWEVARAEPKTAENGIWRFSAAVQFCKVLFSRHMGARNGYPRAPDADVWRLTDQRVHFMAPGAPATPENRYFYDGHSDVPLITPSNPCRRWKTERILLDSEKITSVLNTTTTPMEETNAALAAVSQNGRILRYFIANGTLNSNQLADDSGCPVWLQCSLEKEAVDVLPVHPVLMRRAVIEMCARVWRPYDTSGHGMFSAWHGDVPTCVYQLWVTERVGNREPMENRRTYLLACCNAHVYGSPYIVLTVRYGDDVPGRGAPPIKDCIVAGLSLDRSRVLVNKVSEATADMLLAATVMLMHRL